LPVGLRWLDPVFRMLLGLEARWIGWNFNLPFGLSAICYAEKGVVSKRHSEEWSLRNHPGASRHPS